MNKDLRMEVFASKDKVQPTLLYVYEINSQKIDNTFSIIRGAAWKIRNFNHVGVFEDGKYIYTTEEINTDIPNIDFSISFVEKKKLPVLENRKIYEELIKYHIVKKLTTVVIYNQYQKYICKNEITSKWIMTDKGFRTFTSQNQEISLERKYSIWVDILDNGKAYLRIDTSSIYSSNLTIQNYIERGMNPIGEEVKNDWGKNRQTGVLVEVCDFTVVNDLDFIKGGLKAYYINQNEGYRVEKLSDDTKVVKVRLSSGVEYPYYPQALKPVLTREKVGQIDAAFSMRIEPYVKRDMETRLLLDIDFVSDIGILNKLSGLEFCQDTCTVEELGYRKGMVPLPKLLCGKGVSLTCGEEYKVFNHGFYKKPENAIKIGYIFPKNCEQLFKHVVNAIYDFAQNGKFQSEVDRYITTGLLDIQAKPMIKEEYELGDLTEYKRAAHKIQKIEGIDLVIALVPDGVDENGPYNPFKTVWAKANIPSQMISIKTAELFAKGKLEGDKSKYFLHNITLGILGKTGGVPWIIKDMPGKVDCFVGLDVATLSKGIHYPACSVIFDKFGRLMGFYKPSTPQQGETIGTRILQDIFDQVIFSYEERFGETPKNIMIHRDGFSNENDEWYKNYFNAKGIGYCIVEVRKNISSKLLLLLDRKVTNPSMGYCVYNSDKGYLVTTNVKNQKGSPNPILIERKCGNISMADILTQVLYLSQLHVGSTQKMRLPITTGYADKICKNRDFVPDGKMDDRLFFL